MMQTFHKTGYVYNDLKPENICLGNYYNDEELHILKLIDFGLCSKYMENGEHIDNNKVKVMCGNLAFNSPYSFKFVPRTRRDDIFSILYILIYLYTNVEPFSNEIDRN